MILYHLSRKTDWTIGEKIIAGNEYNPFWEKCMDYVHNVTVDGQEMSIFEMFNTTLSYEVSQKSIDFFKNHLDIVTKECSLYIREQVFEDVRKEFYPELPSRQKCLWLTDYDNLPYWKGIGNRDNPFKTLLTLDVEGKIFAGYDGWLTRDSFSSVIYAERARHYWSGEVFQNTAKEYVFSGTAIIKKVDFI